MTRSFLVFLFYILFFELSLFFFCVQKIWLIITRCSKQNKCKIIWCKVGHSKFKRLYLHIGIRTTRRFYSVTYPYILVLLHISRKKYKHKQSKGTLLKVEALAVFQQIIGFLWIMFYLIFYVILVLYLLYFLNCVNENLFGEVWQLALF